MAGGERINKFLSRAGVCSRREADRLLEAGRITVDGHVAGLGEQVDENSTVLVDGREVKPREEEVVLLFFKPRGIVCSTKRQFDEVTVTEYLHYPIRVFPVGRLDKDSEGLLLMTNIGELSDGLMRGSHLHEKEYMVTVDRPFDKDFLEAMRSGVPILDTVTRPCTVVPTGKATFRITLTQGLNRQIRRMCEALGYKVSFLRRIRVCTLTLEGLKCGEYRKASEEEIRQLRELVRRV